MVSRRNVIKLGIASGAAAILGVQIGPNIAKELEKLPTSVKIQGPLPTVPKSRNGYRILTQDYIKKTSEPIGIGADDIPTEIFPAWKTIRAHPEFKIHRVEHIFGDYTHRPPV